MEAPVMQMCPHCAADNSRSVRYCAECGALLRGLLGRGTVLGGRYRVDGVLGVGGFGAVYRAHHLMLDRVVALKALFDTSPDAQRQFSREAQMLVRLRHPNLASVTDSFIEADGVQYLVMEFIEGQSLAHTISHSGPATPALVEHWATQLLAVLDYLHTQTPSIIHRDIKPGNILLQPDGRVILVDFGIAKSGGAETATTMAARAITPGFSPPEQYGHGTTTPRSDIYALGATLYFLLTGRTPPDGLERLLGAAPLPDLASAAPSAPPALLAAIERAMRPAAVERWASATEFAAALAANPGAAAVVANPRPMTEPATEAVLFAPAPTVALQPTVRARGVRRSWLFGAGVGGALVLLALVWWLVGYDATPSGGIPTAIPNTAVTTPTPDGLAIPLPGTALDLRESPVITLANAAQITQTATIGRPNLVDAQPAPAGDFVAVATSRGVTLLNDKGQLVRTFGAGPRPITALTWDSTGEQLALGREDGSLEVWNVAAGTLVRTWSAHLDSITSLAWQPGSPTLASGSADLAIRSWDTATGVETGQFDGHTGSIRTLSWEPDGQRFASASDDGTVRIWDAPTSKMLTLLQREGEYFGEVLWQPGSSSQPFLATLSLAQFGDSGNTVTIWRTADWQELLTLDAEPDESDQIPAPASITWSGTTKMLVAYTTGELREHDVTSRQSTPWAQTGALALKLSALPNGRVVAAGPERVTVFDRAGTAQWTLDGFNDAIRETEWSGDGSQLIVRNDPALVAQPVQVWSVPGVQAPLTLPVSITNIAAFDWHPATNAVLARYTPDYLALKLAVFDPRTWDVVAAASTTDLISSAAWNPAGDGAVTLSLGGVLTWWNYSGQTLTEIVTQTAHPANTTLTPRGLAWSSDGKYVASTDGEEGALKLWNAQTHELVWELQTPQPGIRSVQWSPDSQLLATGNSDQPQITIWRVADGSVERTIQAAAGAVLSLGWNTDGTLLVAGCDDGFVRLWDAGTGALIAEYRAATAGLAIEWRPDGKGFLSSSNDGTLAVWSVPK